MKINDLKLSDRPRERLISKGPAVLSDSELLAIILGSGNKRKDVMLLSSEIINKYPFNKLKDLSYETLIKIPGIKTAKACTLLATFEIVKRSFYIESEKIFLENSNDIYHYIYSDIMLEKKEILIVILLDTKLKVLKKMKYFNHSPNSIMVPLRNIIEEAINVNAVNIVFVHNHPSNDVTPSSSDKKVTADCYKALRILDIELIDHLVVSDNGYYSFSDNGILYDEIEYDYFR